MGVVTVGTADPTQNINLQDPIEEVIELNLNLAQGTVTMSVKASDDLNEVVRHYPIAMDQAAWIEFYTHFFTDHIRRISREQYDEFKDLEQIQ